MIEIQNLTKTFGNVKAVNNLSVTINEGINGLVGENGAGKSTLLRLIADVYQQDSGKILLDGNSHFNIDVKKNVFFLSDDPYYPNGATIEETFEFYTTLFDLDEELFKQLITNLDLPRRRKVNTFSKGMRRQFFVAIALASKAQYILLDEAFDGLDPLIMDLIKQTIAENAEKRTFVISSHNISSLERLCDTFIVLSKGQCVTNSNVEDISANYVKYQIIFKNKSVNKQTLESLGINVVSFRKLGSICNVVFAGNKDIENLKATLETVLCEQIAIDPDEVIAIEMLNARKKKENK